MTVETRSSAPGLDELAASVGLIRSETARDLRTLTAAGASPRTRRTITAATAAALGLLGAVLGMATRKSSSYNSRTNSLRCLAVPLVYS